MEIYAVDFLHTGPWFVSEHIAATDTNYKIAVPPGEYQIVARLDGSPLSAGGFTFNVECKASSSPCGGNAGNSGLSYFTVESRQDVYGIDIGDWGTDPPQMLVWRVDVDGSPLSVGTWTSPSPKSLASRPLPQAFSTDTWTHFMSSIGGVSLRIPTGWDEVKPPKSFQYPEEVYFSNEQVNTPLALDSQGVWLTIWSLGIGCPFPDWRYATARSTVKMQGGTNHFFFEDPFPHDGPQPFVGYSVRGGIYLYDLYCDEFVFTGVTQVALESNLPAFFSLVETAVFVKPG